jgi:hypothetical protein
MSPEYESTEIAQPLKIIITLAAIQASDLTAVNLIFIKQEPNLSHFI